jgi:hypothetical protein
MYTLPPTLIVTDRGHFVAYRLHPDSGPEVIDHATFTEGVEKISEQVTDKEGSFQSGGNGAGKVHASAERLHLQAELEQRCVRQIGERIQSVLTQYGGLWAFAAPSEINGAILEQLPREFVDRLRINLPKDLARIPSHQVPDHFLKARAHA